MNEAKRITNTLLKETTSDNILEQINDLIAPYTRAWKAAHVERITVEPQHGHTELEINLTLRLSKAAANAEDLTKVLDLDK